MKPVSLLIIILFTLLIKPCRIFSQVAPQDSIALINLYNNTNGPAGWNNKWDSTQPVSAWYGVTVTGERVTSIVLNGNMLSGDLENINISDLSQLTDLELANNQLTGSIPSSIGDLANLQYLFLQNNKLTDSIPSSLGNLSALKYLYLFNNLLNGNIPSTLGNLFNLTDLELYDNKLTGSIPLSFENLSVLTILELSDNHLTDTIPSALGGLSNLVNLELYNNQLTGNIPDSLSYLSKLTGLGLDQNMLTGNIPSSLGNLFNLNFLGLSDNQLSDTIPSSLGNLTNLNELDLFNNHLTGHIPPLFGNLNNVSYINLSRNNLTGSIPSSLGNLSLVTYFDISFNQLTDSIPASLFSGLSNINYLLLSNNQLSGIVPPLIENPSPVLFLTLNNNRLLFDGMEALVTKQLSSSSLAAGYSPQAIIPLNKNGNILSVSAGGTLSNDTFHLYKNGILISTQVGDSIFIINSTGNYAVRITNAIAKLLTLYTDTITVNSVEVQLCPPAATTILAADITGSSYQWQVNTGSGFTDILDDSNYIGSTTDSLQLNDIPSSYYGYQYRCVVDENDSSPFTIKFSDTWTGAINTDWSEPANWGCNSIPDAYTDVIINSGTPVLFTDGICRSLIINKDAGITVNANFTLTITQ